MPNSGHSFTDLIEIARSELPENYQQHLNPHFEKFLEVTGFDRTYVRGRGAMLYDEDGHEYIDCVAGHAVQSLGRSHPDVVAALQSALASDHPGWVQFECNPLSALLGKRLIARVPGDLQYVLFNNSGTEAVECALKLSRRFTGRDAVLHCDKGFHGLTLGALAANGNQTCGMDLERLAIRKASQSMIFPLLNTRWEHGNLQHLLWSQSKGKHASKLMMDICRKPHDFANCTEHF